MKRRTFVPIFALLLAAAPATAQQAQLNAARELYSSARYDEALSVLNGLRPADNSDSAEVKSVEQYRSLCLLALGRGSEAEAAIAAVVGADPMYLPSEAEASPRVRGAFSEVRQRLLPEIARSRYAGAKGAYDRKDYGSAEAQFRTVLLLIDDPDMGGRLGDLRLLVTGFIDLSAAAAAPAPAPEPKKDEPPPPPPPSSSSQPLMPRIFTGEEAGVVPPVAIKQEVPRVPTPITSQTRNRGMLELVVDEQGRVSSLTLRVSIHPVYDQLLLAAARDWKYQPATFNGRPVKFRKIIQISVAK